MDSLSAFPSLPSRERGLKYVTDPTDEQSAKVAPFAGAWIEISALTGTFTPRCVAPFAGAWIEIYRTN